MWCNSWMVRLAMMAGCTGLLTSGLLAGEPRVQARRVVRFVDDAPPRPGSHWLGLECFPLDAALRSQLGLADDEGLIVEQVVPDSPAAKAELKQYDVIVKAGDVKITSLADLMKAVDAAKDQELALEIFRGGKPMSVKATPAARPESQDVLRRIPDRRLHEFRDWVDQLERNREQGPIRYRLFGPGAVVAGEKGLPKGMSVSITRNGDEPAKITVKKGDQSWEVTEKELDKLPDDVRPHVERMLGRGAVALPGMPVMPGLQGFPPATAPVRPDARQLPGSPEKQLQQMMDQIDRLRKQMDELQKNLPKEPKPSANESRA